MNTYHKSREEILDATAGGLAVFELYLGDRYRGGYVIPGVNISNPFLPRPQKTPSFNVFQDNHGIWRFKDFAHPDCVGDCFDLVARLDGLDVRLHFREVLDRIAARLGDCENRVCDAAGQRPQLYLPTVVARPFTTAERAFWNRFGIADELLCTYGVSALDSYTAQSRSGQEYCVRSCIDSPMFAYPYGGEAYKIYRPFARKGAGKFRFIGHKPSHTLWDLDKIPDHVPALLLTAGEKDTLAALAHGVPAVTLNSESARITPEQVRELRRRARHLLSCYDMDDTGRAAADRLFNEHGIVLVHLPCWIADGDGKDVSDFFALGGTSDEFQNLIDEAIARAAS
jgi:Toprim-like